jgi:predicted signal transduction protein with EAL and GGDEF domain
VAEGIEVAGQVLRLREIGCSYGQGYHFARPMSARELSTHLGLPPAVGMVSAPAGAGDGALPTLAQVVEAGA